MHVIFGAIDQDRLALKLGNDAAQVRVEVGLDLGPRGRLAILCAE
jgi:hypothetical protein